MAKVKDNEAREWYIQNTIKNGISRSVLMMQIEQDLYSRQGKDAHKITNFSQRLPSPQSDLALQIFKDPYDFKFLPVTEAAKEQEIETSLISHLSQVFLEMGTGFAYMGNQYKLTVGGEDFFIDMLFYHVRLRSYIIVELKSTHFKPEHLGQLNFYLSVVDEMIKLPADNPSIGLLLCKSKNSVVAEYALKRSDAPIGIAEYRLSNKLPKELMNELPSVEELTFKLSEKMKEEAEIE